MCRWIFQESHHVGVLDNPKTDRFCCFSLSIQQKLIIIIGVVSTENKDAVIVVLSFLKQNKTIIIIIAIFYNQII